MKTYSEVKRKKPFDWFKSLSKNPKNISRKEMHKLVIKSFSWVTCACGN